MNESQAIERANAYILECHGVIAQPVAVHLIQRTGWRPYWWISYGTSIYHPIETAQGATIDGGECILSIDDETGELSVLQ